MRKTVEWWAGIGGQMAVEVRKRAVRKRAVRRKAKRAGTVKKAKKLNKAALKLVDERATEIAQSLYESTMDGNVVSARLLVELAEGNVAAGDAMVVRPLRSLALDLAAEPEWPGVADVEAEVGSREPEGA
jgi:hypothetical protein